MKKLIMFIVPLFISAILCAHPEEPAPADNSKISWHTVTVIDYKPGTENDARELIKKFENASITAGTPSPEVYWFENGKYDLVLTWELNKQPAESECNWSTGGDEWWSTLVALEGSEEAAKQLQTSYKELIASSVTNVSRQAK